jgi:cell division protein FtsI (penicillin-binding protein 3)
MVPQVKKGYAGATKTVLEKLNLKAKASGVQNDEMVTINTTGKTINFEAFDYDFDHLPDLKGMGLRDAVYEIERRGMKAKVKGVGKVVQQSMHPGSKNQEGQIVEIELHQD